MASFGSPVFTDPSGGSEDPPGIAACRQARDAIEGDVIERSHVIFGTR